MEEEEEPTQREAIRRSVRDAYRVAFCPVCRRDRRFSGTACIVCGKRVP